MVNSARANCEVFFVAAKARNRRNTLCIPRFGDKAAAEKDRKAPKRHLIIVYLFPASYFAHGFQYLAGGAAYIVVNDDIVVSPALRHLALGLVEP